MLMFCMALEDYLIPGEEIKFQSGTEKLIYGGKKYNLILTNKRFLLHSTRGITKKDDVVTIKLDELQGVKYRERGLISRKGVIEIQGKTLTQITGKAIQLKTLYQQIMHFI